MIKKRKFVSISAVGEANSLRFVALADDGTAWTAFGRSQEGVSNFEKLSWVRLSDLPAEDKKTMFDAV